MWKIRIAWKWLILEGKWHDNIRMSMRTVCWKVYVLSWLGRKEKEKTQESKSASSGCKTDPEPVCVWRGHLKLMTTLSPQELVYVVAWKNSWWYSENSSVNWNHFKKENVALKWQRRWFSLRNQRDRIISLVCMGFCLCSCMCISIHVGRSVIYIRYQTQLLFIFLTFLR